MAVATCDITGGNVEVLGNTVTCAGATGAFDFVSIHGTPDASTPNTITVANSHLAVELDGVYITAGAPLNVTAALFSSSRVAQIF
jgi:hypothetical protein